MKTFVTLLFSSVLLVSCTQQKLVTHPNFIDSDLDGVHDYRDNCPNEPGSIFNMGCPNNEPKLPLVFNKEKSTDSDLDGIPDDKDECPLVYGSPFNQGCPFQSNSFSQIENFTEDDFFCYYFSNVEPIEFNKNENQLSEDLIEKLNNYVEVLNKCTKPNQVYYVVGHTDASGSSKSNQIISEKRAQSVKDYLVSKGISSERLIVLGKGDTDLKHVECNPSTDCPEWKNTENRRVVFRVPDSNDLASFK